ncbi:hypothetical protein BDZ89DRAFT_1165526 [Hymenopellis radicata]|nr:hypothetical protein BDZ89DRAFT_1165526 [Hymenopellis radicata]
MNAADKGDKAEPFYEALEGVLNELRTVTLDNHDAEAFLRPVLKSEVPDYHQVISQPMDFQTMQRKVKNKHYSNKHEFKADLELIWRNCYTYNAVEGHHLRKCVDRLKVKAQHLLANITDRKDRMDPHIPMPKHQTPRIKISMTPQRSVPRTFEDMPALVRTPEGMAKFAKLERGVAEDDNERRPRKRIKLDPDQETLDAWWSTAREPELLANGLPPSFRSSRPKRRKRKPPQPGTSSSSGGLLKLMNNNIRTMKRVRRTHTKFSALNEEGGEEVDEVVPELDEVDDRPWTSEGEVGQEGADQCVTWMTRKVLEHTGFQGTSRATLDVLSGVTAEYFYNVGRTIRFLSDKFGGTMSPEEIILHTLFESGVTRIQDLERYVKDDVERYGSRLGDLEKKLVGAYREATSGGPELEDEGLFEEEDEDEAGVLALGDFADTHSGGAWYYESHHSQEAAQRETAGQYRERSRSSCFSTSPISPATPFVPITASRIDDQIGLLRDRFRKKLQPIYPVLDANGVPVVQEPRPDPNKDEEIPEDQPTPAQMKMGPIGQIASSLKGGGNMPKKANGEKKKGAGSGTGTGTGKKKKSVPPPRQCRRLV